MLLASLYFLWPAAIGMVIANSISIYLARRSSTILGRLVDYLILTMMNGMLLGPLLHFIFPYYLNFPRTVEVSVFLMAAESLPFVGRFISMALNGTQGSGRPVLYLTASFVLVDEALMSIDFSLATARGAAAGYLDFAHIMDYLSSYWFVVPMGLEMALSSVLLTRDFRREHSVTFMVQAVAMALVPTAFNQPLWVPVSIYLSGSVMTAYFIYMFEHLYRSKAVETGFSEYLLLLLLIYGFMMAGIFLWQYSGDADILSISMLALMALYLYGALWKGALEGRKRYWTVDARWTLLFMLLVFFAEFFMGAVFDAQFFGARQFVSSLSLVAIHGGVSGKIASSLYDGFMFLAEISLSTWFLVMMGIEMGSLGYFKAREARNTENKVRLYLMIAAYGIYSVLLPDFIIPNPSAVPFIGWSMGIGTGGPLAPVFILPILLTYLISGILSLLFGARQLCSVFCTAPLMYQGTFYSAMKSFNSGNRVARSLTVHDRRARLLYRATSLMVYSSLAAAGALSLLDSIHVLDIRVYGTDPEYFVYLMLFGVAWYVTFLTMPLLGSYACINTGYCHWGNFNRFVSRFGLFRLKVLDPSLCVKCRDKPCAKACPVGNHAQPGSFIATGQYRDSRCVGIGECVEACPYDNIFFYDIRGWIKERLRGAPRATSED